MINLTREEAQQIVDALKETWYHVGTFAPTEHAVDLYNKAIELLCARLALHDMNEAAKQNGEDL